MEENNRRLDDWLASYMEYTDDTEPPELYRKWVGISTLAGALERRVWVDWGKGLTWYPNFYVILVGPSGKARKSTALRIGQQLLTDIEAPMTSEAITREALIQHIHRHEKSSYDNNGNMVTHSSLNVIASEFTNFLGYNSKEMMTCLTDWYDCPEEWTYRTKSQGTNAVQGVFLNILGATTPSSLRESLPQSSIGGGFTSRIIFVFEEEKGKRIDYPWLIDEDKELYNNLVHDLKEVQGMIGRYGCSEEMIDNWTLWRDDIEDKPPIEHAKFQGYNQRRPMHTIKLAMVISASKRGDFTVTWEDFKEADIILDETEKKMADAFLGMGKSSDSVLKKEVSKFIYQQESTTRSKVLRSFYEDVRDAEHLDNILGLLKGMGVITERQNVDEKGNNKTRLIWLGLGSKDSG